MAVKTEKELNETQRNLWLKAVAAVELRNLGYAISLLQEILKQEPQFLTGRQLLRRTEVTKNKSTKRSFFNISTAPIAVMKAQREIKKDPKRAVEMLEKVLEDEPDKGQRDGDFARTAKPGAIDQRLAQATDRRNARSSQGGADKRRPCATAGCVERGKGRLGGSDRLVSMCSRSD